MNEVAIKKNMTFMNVLIKYRVATGICLSILFGFIFSTASIYEEFFPFMPAIVGSMTVGYSFFSLIGGAIGCVLVFNEEFLFKYLGIAAIIFFCKILYRILNKKESRIANAVISLVSFLTVNFIGAYSAGSYPLIYIYAISESILCSSLVFFYSLTINSLKLLSLPDKYYLSNKEKTSLLISVLSFIIALCSISVSNLSIGVMAAVILVLSSLYIFPAKTYLTVSIAVFVALTLNTPDALNVYAMIPVGILITSLFGKKNRLMCYLIFAAVVSVGSLYSGYNLLTVPTLLDIIVGIVLCTFIPLERISRKSSDEKYSAAMDISLKNMVESKLGCASDCLMQIADTINELSDTKNESTSYSDGEILSGVCDKICFKCSRKLYCWSDRYSDTTDAFYKSIKHIKLGHTDPKDIFPSYFLSKCTNALEIMTMVSDSLKETAQKKISGRNMTAAKSAIVESYRCLSYLLNEVSDEITSMESIDADGLTVFSEILENYEIKDAHGVCERHDSGKFKFRFEGSDVAPKTIAKIKSDLEESFGIKLSAAHISKKKDGCEIEFSEAHIFSIEGAALQNCNRKEKVCGDSFKTFTSKSGNHFSVLCDGMGSGKNAAIDAIMCSEALSEMLSADIPIKSVMKIVNSMIESKSEDESSCAIDVLKIDSYTGEAHIIKAGGVVSIIKQDGKIKKVIGESMPIGILSEIRLFEKKLKLRSGDVVLTVSDGALELGTEWLEGILFSDRSGDPKEISKKIERELSKSIHAFSDDISILITAII